MIEAGAKLGRYEIRSKIGQGGMGEVYQGRDTQLARDVAVKVLPTTVSTDADRLRRFEQEACAASPLNHPNILIDGDPLADVRNARRIVGVVANGRYLDRPALDRMLATAEKLARSGQHDLIHRPGQERPLK